MSRLDESLYPILKALPPLPFAKLIRASAESQKSSRQAFLKAGILPTFAYPKALVFDAQTYRDHLTKAKEKISSVTCSEVLRSLYLDKLSELEKRAALLQAIAIADDDTVSRISLELYGSPVTNLDDFETEFVSRLQRSEQGDVHYHQKTITATDFAVLIQQALDHYGLKRWEVKLSSRRRLQCSHAPKSDGLIIRIPKKLSVSRERARRLIAHEIEVHVLRRANGNDSQLHLLEYGCANYNQTEEGLALYHQHQGDPAIRKHPPGFWDAWSSALMFEVGFAAAYARLYQAQFDMRQSRHEERPKRDARRTAWHLCLRASRGITKPGQPGIGFFRDHIYRQGYLDIARAIGKSSSDKVLPLLFVGKVGLSDLDTIKQLDLKPGRLPDDIARSLVPKQPS